MHAGGAILASVCSGSLMLAEAGLLDGVECACHWGYRDLFREHYPNVRFRDASILSFAGKDARIITAAAVTSWQDLAVYLIARLCGAQHAIRTAKVYLLAGHQDGQLPYAAMPRRVQKSDAVIGSCQAWIAQNYVRESGCDDGEHAASSRAPSRAASGLRPVPAMDYARSHRGGQAAHRDETAGIDDVGFKVGYETRRSFAACSSDRPASRPPHTAGNSPAYCR
jgi:transcriptional regulator GlxA family with amidase domain